MLVYFIELEQITMKNLVKYEKESLERIHSEGDKVMIMLEKMEIKLKDNYHSYHILQQKQQLSQHNYVKRIDELSQLTKELCSEQKSLLIEKKKVRIQRYQLDLLLQHMNDIEPMLLLVNDDDDGSGNRMMNYQSTNIDDKYSYNQHGSINDMMRSTYPLSSPLSSSHLAPSSSSYAPSLSYPPSSSYQSSSSPYASSQPTTINPKATSGIVVDDDYTNEVKNSLSDAYGDQHDFVKAIKGQLIEPKSFRLILL